MCHPDYDVDLRLSAAEFTAIAGMAFEATVVPQNDSTQIPGTLIVPECNKFFKLQPIATAWLWCKTDTGLNVGTVVSITLGDLCDPMEIGPDSPSASKYAGLRFNGVISRDRNADRTTNTKGRD